MTGRKLRASPSAGLNGRVRAPGDKSISHRALILGGLATGETRIEGLLEGDDVLRTAAAVAAFGAAVERTGEGAWRVRGEGRWRSPAAEVDCGNAGTAVRLLMGAAAGFPLTARFGGDASLSRRPMGRVIEPLARMGARFEGDRLPLTLIGGGLRGIAHRSAQASAQVKSAVLLAGLNADGPVSVIEPSASRDHTERMLRAFGAEVETVGGDEGVTVTLGQRRRLQGVVVGVPVDPSSAAFLLVAALITSGSAVTVEGVGLNPARTGLFTTLLEMGADLTISDAREVGGEPVGDVTARSSSLRGAVVPADRAPSMIDEYPVLAIAAAFAEGDTVMRGVGELRVKESDRIAAVVAGLRACGVDADAGADTLTIGGGGRPPAGGATVQTHGDHRIAMSFLTLGLGARGAVTVDEAEMVATSFPGFAALMRRIRAQVEEAS